MSGARALLLAAFVVLTACVPSSSPNALLVRADRILDVRAGKYLEGAVVVVDGARIVRVIEQGADLPAGRLLEFKGLTLVPGLIDAHVHLAWGPVKEGQPLPGIEAAATTLAAGFTTVRNPGSSDWADLKLRDAIASGRVHGPRMLAAGPGLGRPGATCENVFGPEAKVMGVAEARAAARRNLDAGADFLKVCAGGGVVADVEHAGDVELDEAEIRAIVEEARARGKRVAAHAQGTAAIANAVRAGVASIEHGGWIDAATARLMKERGTYLVPTMYRLDVRLARAQGAGRPAAEIAALRSARDAMRANCRRAIEMGVPIALGTDATVIPHGENARELATLVELGMTPLQAIRSATLEAARLLGLEDRVGAIERGKAADLVAVDGDPLNDVRVLQSVRWVMKDGVEIR